MFRRIGARPVSGAGQFRPQTDICLSGWPRSLMMAEGGSWHGLCIHRNRKYLRV